MGSPPPHPSITLPLQVSLLNLNRGISRCSPLQFFALALLLGFVSGLRRRLRVLRMHPIKVLLHVALLVEGQGASVEGAHEGLLVGVDAEVRVKLA